MEDFRYTNETKKDNGGTKIIAVSIAAFCIAAIVVLLVAVFVLQEFVVSVCVLMVLETAMAALLHKMEVWKHGVLLAAQFVVAAVLQRVALGALCVVVYVAAIVALQVMSRWASK